MSVFEEIIYEGAVWTVGDPTFIGLLVFIFFAGFVMLQNLPTSGKVLIIAGGALLGLAFMPTWVAVMFGLIFSGILFLGLWRLLNR